VSTSPLFLESRFSGAGTPFTPLRIGWRHRRLIARLTRRQIEERYRGSILGFSWILLTPLLLLCVYTFVFSVVLQAKWGGQADSSSGFALYLFSGLIVYNIFAESMNEAPDLMGANKIYIKQMLFPVEILPWVTLASALFRFAASFLLLAVFFCLMRGLPPLTVLALPLVLVPVLLLTVGGVWIFSSLGVFLRDLSQVVGLITTALLFLSPIFYSPENVPHNLRSVYDLNPFAVLLEAHRQLLFEGHMPAPNDFLALCGFSWLVAWLGYGWFMKTKEGFADVL